MLTTTSPGRTPSLTNTASACWSKASSFFFINENIGATKSIVIIPDIAVNRYAPCLGILGLHCAAKKNSSVADTFCLKWHGLNSPSLFRPRSQTDNTFLASIQPQHPCQPERQCWRPSRVGQQIIPPLLQVFVADFCCRRFAPKFRPWLHTNPAIRCPA